jgi:phenylpropionate dioxygenase-like ring-hydroxylating dioxygenase large terminal subunit
MNQEIDSIEKCEVVFGLDTALYEFQEQLELASIYEGLFQKNSESLVLNFYVMAV